MKGTHSSSDLPSPPTSGTSWRADLKLCVAVHHDYPSSSVRTNRLSFVRGSNRRAATRYVSHSPFESVLYQDEGRSTSGRSLCFPCVLLSIELRRCLSDTAAVLLLSTVLMLRCKSW